ncbi:glycosyltransferase family protein [Ravibacter arvi]|uniref:Glycosyltransferase family protein n=1 Tax=Ravibacter arvi TaxID=2051041 RepID=A0ABP8LUA0_9BACT
MKVLFLIQGEGNGHLTQAISLFQLLSEEGHEITGAMIGSLNGTKKPAFFTESIDCPVYTFKSIGLSYSGQGKLTVRKTLAHLITTIPDISTSLQQIHGVVSQTQPDLIINFYEVCGGLYNLFFQNQVPVCCIGHQYLLDHPNFRLPDKKFLHRLGIRLLTKSTAIGAAGTFALSFSDAYRSTGRLTVVPPLLRREFTGLRPEKGNHILVYLTQPRLAREIEKWHRRHPTTTLHCFCNNPLLKNTHQVGDHLYFHPNDTATFRRLLQTCRGFVSTAGFESVCEAMLLDKPVMIVPVPNHYEQACNALDAVLHRIGITSDRFNLDLLLKYLPHHHPRSAQARIWCAKTKELLIRPLEQIAGHTAAAEPALI